MKKVARYYLIEVVFNIIMLAFLAYFKYSYSFASTYETPLFIMLILLVVAGNLFLLAPLNRLYSFVCVGIIGIYLIAQNIYFLAFKQYFRLNTIFSLYKEGVASQNSANEFIGYRHLLPFICLLVVVILFLFIYFKFQKRVIDIKGRLISVGLALLCLLSLPFLNKRYNNLILATRKQADSFQLNKTDYYLYDTLYSTRDFVDKFSLLPLAYRDVESLASKKLFTKEDKLKVAKFLKERQKPAPNKMSGLFKNKNVLFVLAESLNDFVIDKQLTPTLYKLKNEGLFIENFNTSTMTGSTSSSEFMANTSLLPLADGKAVCYGYPYNTYPTTLAKLFKSVGYHVRAYHNNYGQFYNRHVLFKNLGYDKFYDCSELGLENESSDQEVMAKLKWIFAEAKEPFADFWISYSGHQPYNFKSVGVNRSDVEKIKEVYPALDEAYASYVAKNMDLDHALQDLLVTLKRANKLQDFVLVIFGDHYVKGLDNTANSPFYQMTKQNNRDRGAYTDLIIYNAQTKPLKYAKVSTLLDLLPTVANLWDIAYDYQTVLGRDIFDPTYQGFHYGEWDYLSSDHYLSSLNGKNIKLLDDYFTLEEAQKEVNYYLQLEEVSRLILKLDYFSKE